jgi:hypothetical protein
VKFADDALAVADEQIAFRLRIQHLPAPFAPDASVMLVKASIATGSESVSQLTSVVSHDALVICVLHRFVPVVPVEFSLNFVVFRWSASCLSTLRRYGSPFLVSNKSSVLILLAAPELVSSSGSVWEESSIFALGRIVFSASLCVSRVFDSFDHVRVQIRQVHARVSEVSNWNILSTGFHAQNFVMFMKNQRRDRIAVYNSLLLVGVVNDADYQLVIFSGHNDAFHH